MNAMLAVVAAAFASAGSATAWYRRRALHSGILDVPNQRSSHLQPTPTGGGIGIISGVCVAGALASWCAGVLGGDWLLLLITSLLLGVLGFADDRMRLGVGLRIACQTSAALVVVLFGVARHLDNGGIWSPCLGFVAVGAVLYLVWFTNLFNFMDGIDGMAGAQALFIAASGVLLGTLKGSSAPDSMLLLAGIAAAVAGFLLFNWPPARIFMGDTGSLFLGFLLAGGSLLSAARGELVLPVWLILWAPFACDASITLVDRMIRGQPLQSAHRDHAYQRLARRPGSHRSVTLSVQALNLCWLLPLAIFALAQPAWQLPILLLAYAPIAAGVVLVIRLFEPG
jgi:Fuc2NAc and GlcNAc transferase